MPLAVADFIPLVFFKIAAKIDARRMKDRLFDGDDVLFMEHVRGARCYGEYGTGASTRWVLANTTAKVIAVDTSEKWVKSVQTAARGDPRLEATWVDLGPIGLWGRPTTYARRDRYTDYVSAIWRGSARPDVVLIDGRFRVCCFLHSLLEAEPGTRIFVDDYSDRPHYHVIEELVAPSQACGRQRLFIVPTKIDREAVRALEAQFLMVMD